MTDRISPRSFRDAEGTGDWRVLGEGACVFFRTGSFADGARLVQAISGLEGIDARRPDVDLRHDGVVVRLITIADGWYGMTAGDVDLAVRISALARELGLSAEPSALRFVQVTVDALARSDVLPFWRAVLGYADRPDSTEDLMDPLGRGPALWFQQLDAPRPQRNRVHLDVWVPDDQGESRVQAALAAGGRLVDDAHAPEFWVLADAEGNEACVCTIG
jgi:4a-hydroxytetrahydrobiopterin dehydratase